VAAVWLAQPASGTGKQPDPGGNEEAGWLVGGGRGKQGSTVEAATASGQHGCGGGEHGEVESGVIQMSKHLVF
jgi:hypothetical protein